MLANRYSPDNDVESRTTAAAVVATAAGAETAAAAIARAAGR